MNINPRQQLFNQIQRTIFQILTVLLLNKAAVCQNWLQKRHALRRKCHIHAVLVYGRKALNAVIRDISPQGACLESPHEFRPGDRIQLQFSLHYLEAPIELQGTVVWADGDASGLRFDI